MATRRSPRKRSQEASKPVDVIELSSDSEPEAPGVGREQIEPVDTSQDPADQPLLKAAGIKYKADDAAEEQPQTDKDTQRSTPNANLALRARETGSAKHRHVSIEIPLPTSSELRRRKAEAAAGESREGNEEEVFKTPSEKRQHITFDDSDYDEFVTPREAPASNPLENSVARPAGEDAESTGGNAEERKEDVEKEEEEESDDDAPPEAVSTRVAEAQSLKAAEAAARAVKHQAAVLKRKRRERDAFFKQQAEERKRAQRQADADEADDAGASTPETTPEPAEEKKRGVPKLLPLELLESDDEDDAPQQPLSAADGKHKRRKLSSAEQRLLVEPKLPRDKRIGSTAYRVVAGKGDTRMAPKVKKQSVNLKETLLRRDRVAQPRGGFFVKKR